MTVVNYLVHTDEHNEKEVFAFFPEMQHGTDPKVLTSYAHIGQHSACRIEYAMECRNATHAEYIALHNELIGQGYDDLEIVPFHDYWKSMRDLMLDMKLAAKAQKFTYDTISRRTGINAGNLWRMFNGHVNVTLVTAFKIAKSINYTIIIKKSLS